MRATRIQIGWVLGAALALSGAAWAGDQGHTDQGLSPPGLNCVGWADGGLETDAGTVDRCDKFETGCTSAPGAAWALLALTARAVRGARRRPPASRR